MQVLYDNCDALLQLFNILDSVTVIHDSGCIISERLLPLMRTSMRLRRSTMIHHGCNTDFVTEKARTFMMIMVTNYNESLSGSDLGLGSLRNAMNTFNNRDEAKEHFVEFLGDDNDQGRRIRQ